MNVPHSQEIRKTTAFSRRGSCHGACIYATAAPMDATQLMRTLCIRLAKLDEFENSPKRFLMYNSAIKN
jgi:hypothetical protein